MVMGFGDLRRGSTIELDGAPYKVESYYQQKMQQRAPVYHIKLRNLVTGQLLDRSFSGYGIKLNKAPVENRVVQYLYEDQGLYYFMDIENFDQFPVDTSVVGDAVNYLVDQAELEIVFWKESPVSLEMPVTVDLLVIETPPGYKGDTAAGGTKPAKMETGIMVNVPMFIGIGDKVKVDTRSGSYIERV